MSLVTSATVLTILIVIAIILFGCVLPSMIIWLIIRSKTNETDRRTQLALAALEKNPNMDIEELLKKTDPKPKPRLLKEKLLRKMTWGTLTGLLALVLIGVGTWMGYVGGSNPDDLAFLAFWGCILLAVSISCFISYFVGKKMLATEIEAEEKQLTTQA